MRISSFKKCKIHRKHLYDILEPIQSYHYWMFTDSKISRIEILPPTLDNLNMMREYQLWLVLKGFRNPLEFKVWDRLRINQGFSAMMYASKSVGSDLIHKAITSMLNDESLPTRSEINQSVEDNRLTPVIDSVSEERINERERYRRRYENYSCKLRHKFFTLIKQHRIQVLDP